MKLLIAAVLAAALTAPAAAQHQHDAKPAKSSWSDFFSNLKKSLSESAVSGQRKKGRSASAVAAVRGRGQANTMADPNEPTLKGGSSSKKLAAQAKLDKEFEGAVDLVAAGKHDEGIAALKAFKEKNPKHRTEDVDKAIEGATALAAEKTASAPAAAE